MFRFRNWMDSSPQNSSKSKNNNPRLLDKSDGSTGSTEDSNSNNHESTTSFSILFDSNILGTWISGAGNNDHLNSSRPATVVDYSSVKTGLDSIELSKKSDLS